MEKKKVLIIDDDKEYCELVSLWLKDSFELGVAHDGETGIDMARKDRPDLILLDVMMPKLSGFSLAWVFRHDPRYAGTIVVFVTALTVNKRSREKVDGFLRKPFSRLELLDVIERALGRGDRAPEFTFPVDEMSDGKRRAPRVEVCIPATFEAEGDVHEGMIRSLSPWGAFFETPTTLPLEETGRVRFSSGRTTISMDSYPIYHRAGEGAGLRLIPQEMDVESELCALIEDNLPVRAEAC